MPYKKLTVFGKKLSSFRKWCSCY